MSNSNNLRAMSWLKHFIMYYRKCLGHLRGKVVVDQPGKLYDAIQMNQISHQRRNMFQVNYRWNGMTLHFVNKFLIYGTSMQINNSHFLSYFWREKWNFSLFCVQFTNQTCHSFVKKMMPYLFTDIVVIMVGWYAQF